MLTELYTALSTARESSDTAVRALAGEDVGMAMDMGMGAPDAGMDPALGGMPGEEPMSDFDTDGFDATDAAVGGEEELGRERR